MLLFRRYFLTNIANILANYNVQLFQQEVQIFGYYYPNKNEYYLMVGYALAYHLGKLHKTSEMKYKFCVQIFREATRYASCQR